MTETVDKIGELWRIGTAAIARRFIVGHHCVPSHCRDARKPGGGSLTIKSV
jgi:hypothetical protein